MKCCRYKDKENKDQDETKKSQCKRSIKRLSDKLKELQAEKKELIFKSKDIYSCSFIYLFVVFVSRWCVSGFLLQLHVQSYFQLPHSSDNYRNYCSQFELRGHMVHIKDSGDCRLTNSFLLPEMLHFLHCLFLLLLK